MPCTIQPTPTGIDGVTLTCKGDCNPRYYKEGANVKEIKPTCRLVTLAAFHPSRKEFLLTEAKCICTLDRAGESACAYKQTLESGKITAANCGGNNCPEYFDDRACTTKTNVKRLMVMEGNAIKCYCTIYHIVEEKVEISPD
jgi:hypothetical protein